MGELNKAIQIQERYKDEEPLELFKKDHLQKRGFGGNEAAKYYAMYIEEGELEKRSEDQREQRRCEFIEEAGEEKREESK